MDSKHVIRMLEAEGWKLVRIRGSHHHFKHPTKRDLVTVTHPSKDLPEGTLHNIRRRAGL